MGRRVLAEGSELGTALRGALSGCQTVNSELVFSLPMNRMFHGLGCMCRPKKFLQFEVGTGVHHLMRKKNFVHQRVVFTQDASYYVQATLTLLYVLQTSHMI